MRISIKILIIMLLLSVLYISNSFISNYSYARYVGSKTVENDIKVAKFGNLKLIEKLNGEIQENNLNTIGIVESDFILGEDINKEVYIEYTESDVSTYLFLELDVVNWEYDDETRIIEVSNNNSKIMFFYIDDIWNYVESLSNNKKIIFYHEIDINNNNLTKFNVMNQIKTGIISVDDIPTLNECELKFNAYAIQKNDSISIEQMWDYLNMN